MAVQKKIVTRKPLGGTSQSATGALALGVAGNVYDNSPLRAHPFQLTADTKCGYYVAGQKGLIINPREYALIGGLTANLTLKAGQVCTIGTFGHFVVQVALTATGASASAAKTAYAALSIAAGDNVYYKTTGEITNLSTGGATQITGAKFIIGASGADSQDVTVTESSGTYTAAGYVLAVIELN